MTMYEETIEQFEFLSQVATIEGIIMGVEAYQDFSMSYPQPKPDVLTVGGFPVLWDEEMKPDQVSFISPDKPIDDYTYENYEA